VDELVGPTNTGKATAATTLAAARALIICVMVEETFVRRQIGTGGAHQRRRRRYNALNYGSLREAFRSERFRIRIWMRAPGATSPALICRQAGARDCPCVDAPGGARRF
jgi:hypothetical protein